MDSVVFFREEGISPETVLWSCGGNGDNVMINLGCREIEWCMTWKQVNIQYETIYSTHLRIILKNYIYLYMADAWCSEILKVLLSAPFWFLSQKRKQP